MLTDAERNALVVEALPIIQSTAHRFARANGITDHAEVEGEAALIAVRFSRRFDPTRGVPFEVYLHRFLYLNLKIAFKAPRTPSRAFWPEFDKLPDQTPESALDWTIGGLDWISEGRDREIVKKRLAGHSLREIGKEFGISGSGVGRIMKKYFDRWNGGKRTK